jgi:hypothetical protein
MERQGIKRRVGLAVLVVASMALGLPLGSQGATTAPTPKAPSVYTEGYTGVSISSATIKGSVNPHGLETSYVFQYGSTTAYGAQTSAAPVGAGTATVQVSQPITGLQPGTIYHYRLVATSAAGTTTGQDAAFTTKKIPLTFKLATAPNPVVFGNSFSVSGTLSGTEAANHEVVLQANPFPYLEGFKNTGNPELTDAAGNFTFTVRDLLENTQFRVTAIGTPTVNSAAKIERVALRVSLHLRSTGRPGFVRMYGAVRPAAGGARVYFQLLRPGLRPLTVGSTSLRRAAAGTSRFIRVVRIRRGGLYRAIVRVDNGKQVPGHSRALLIG